MSTTFVKCGCGKDKPTPAQAFQDQQYGIGRRVANHNAKGQATCTCCGKVHHVDDAPRPKKK